MAKEFNCEIHNKCLLEQTKEINRKVSFKFFWSAVIGVLLVLGFIITFLFNINYNNQSNYNNLQEDIKKISVGIAVVQQQIKNIEENQKTKNEKVAKTIHQINKLIVKK